MTSREFLALQENANSRKNVELANSTYERVMSELANKENYTEVYESLKDAPSHRLPHLVEKFFQVVRRPNRNVYASGTLHTLWSNIARILATREVDPVDIKHNPLFQTAREILAKKANESAKAGRGPGVQAKNPIKPEHFQRALAAGTIGRGNPQALLCMTHTMPFVCGFGLRPGAECHMVTNDDLTYGPVDQKYGRPEWVRLNPRVTKTRKGRSNDKKDIASKVFPNDDHPEICYVRTIVAYQEKKKPEQRKGNAQFFLNPNPHAQENPQKYSWYMGDGLAPGRQAGIHHLERLMTDALEAVGVDCKAEGYSAYSVRKSMFQGGADGNVDDITLSRYGGQKSIVSKRAYINSNDVHHEAASLTIQERLFQNQATNYGNLMKKVEAKSRGEMSSKVDQERRDTRSPRIKSGRSSSGRKSRVGGDCSDSRSGQSKSRSRQRKTRSRSRQRRSYSRRSRSRRWRSKSRGRRRSCSKSGEGRQRMKSGRRRGRRSRSRSRHRRSRTRSRRRRSRTRSRRWRSRTRSRQRRSRTRSRRRRYRTRSRRGTSRTRSRRSGSSYSGGSRSESRSKPRGRGVSRRKRNSRSEDKNRSKDRSRQRWRSSSQSGQEENTGRLEIADAPYQNPYANTKTNSTSPATKPGSASHASGVAQEGRGSGGQSTNLSGQDGRGTGQRMVQCPSCAKEVKLSLPTHSNLESKQLYLQGQPDEEGRNLLVCNHCSTTRCLICGDAEVTYEHFYGQVTTNPSENALNLRCIVHVREANRQRREVVPCGQLQSLGQVYQTWQTR